MDHGPAVQLGQDHAAEFKSKLGLRLFIVYGLIYAGFVVINTVRPKVMAKDMFLGLNMAVVYGFGLIVLAIVMGLVYNGICTRKENELNRKEGEVAS